MMELPGKMRVYWEKDADDGTARKDDGYIGRRMLRIELPGKMMGILGEG